MKWILLAAMLASQPAATPPPSNLSKFSERDQKSLVEQAKFFHRASDGNLWTRQVESDMEKIKPGIRSQTAYGTLDAPLWYCPKTEERAQSKDEVLDRLDLEDIRAQLPEKHILITDGLVYCSTADGVLFGCLYGTFLIPKQTLDLAPNDHMPIMAVKKSHKAGFYVPSDQARPRNGGGGGVAEPGTPPALVNQVLGTPDSERPTSGYHEFVVVEPVEKPKPRVNREMAPVSAEELSDAVVNGLKLPRWSFAKKKHSTQLWQWNLHEVKVKAKTP